jgi:hypothetical protein
MTDEICSKAQINEIAGNLNAGHREEAMHGISACTLNLGNNSDYAKFMHQNGAKVLGGDATAMTQAETNFAKLANDERQMWQSMISAASGMAGGKDSQGLCKLTIVEDKNVGPHPDVRGAKCE